VNLGRYINKLLLEHETVIVPGLGAFISEYIPAGLNAETGEMTPPSKNVYFEPKIKNNDGLLAGIIAIIEQVSETEALAKIDKERDEILFRLDKGEKVTLEKTGVLLPGEGRTIGFEPFYADNLLLDAYGLTNISLKKGNKTLHIEDTREKEYQKSEETYIDQSYKLQNADYNENYPPTDAEDTNKKSYRKWLWIMLLIIPIVLAGIYIFNNNSHKKKKETVDIKFISTPDSPGNNADTGKLMPVADMLITDSLSIANIDSAEITPEKIDSTVYITPEPGKYYLVTGSFKEKLNSIKHIRNLESKGYEPFHLGKQGNFYIVGIEIYNTEREAFAAQYNFLEKNPESGAWVFNNKQDLKN
jgi:hypothetical protein